MDTICLNFYLIIAVQVAVLMCANSHSQIFVPSNCRVLSFHPREEIVGLRIVAKICAVRSAKFHEEIRTYRVEIHRASAVELSFEAFNPFAYKHFRLFSEPQVEMIVEGMSLAYSKI